MFSLLTVSVISSYLASINAPPVLVGFVVAISYISQLVQIPSALIAERFSRKRISLLANVISRISLLAIGVTLLVNLHSNVLIFVVFFAIYNVFKEVSAVSWSSWMRDLIPDHIRGEFYSKRIAYGKFVALFIVLAFSVLFNAIGELTFSILFLTAFAAGMVSVYFIKGIDDVEVECRGRRSLTEPLKNSNFLKLTSALSIWKFASEMALPFFSVYVITVLKYPVWVVIALASLSQISSMYFLRISGGIMDRFGNKPVATLSFVSFSLAALLFTFTTMPEKHPLTPLLLILIYMLDGFYSSVPPIAFMNMIAKITPKGSSASYYAINNAMASIFAAAGSISGGLIASFLLSTNFTLKIDIESSLGHVEIPAIHLASYDFLFLISSILSIVAAKIIGFFNEDNALSEKIVKNEIKHAVIKDVQTLMMYMHLPHMNPQLRWFNFNWFANDAFQRIPTPSESQIMFENSVEDYVRKQT
ncbi:MFS transporter [Ferroglobus placidus]|nr:MFS transporter [Ferroglobus placidus]